MNEKVWLVSWRADDSEGYLTTHHTHVETNELSEFVASLEFEGAERIEMKQVQRPDLHIDRESEYLYADHELLGGC